MPRFLLDEHLSPRIAPQFRAKCPDARIESVQRWGDGRLSGMADDHLLGECHKHGWTLVTYDQATIVPLLRAWAEQGIPHGGVIFVDDRTIAANDVGGLIRGLAAVWKQEKDSDWANVVIYLTRSPG